MTDSEKIQLVCTVGGSPDPILKSVAHWQPVRIHFVCSKGSQALLPGIKEAIGRLSGAPGLGAMDHLVLRDEEDLSAILKDLRVLTRWVRDWGNRGAGFTTVADITGGTKCMSAALASIARRWPCRFSYVGGHRRSKDGLGVVEAGEEALKCVSNPWNDLGFQAVEDAVALFNHGSCTAAVQLLEGACRRVDDQRVKSELQTTIRLMKAYVAWDCFAFAEAEGFFKAVHRDGNNLLANFLEIEGMLDEVDRHRLRMQTLSECVRVGRPAIEIVEELWLNALRRAAEGRLDDAVARLYRSAEAMAQCCLAELGIPESKRVPLQKVPEPLRTEWSGRADDGSLQLGLQDAYRLLHALGHGRAAKFYELGLGERDRSPLNARNQSILAHGVQPVSTGALELLTSAVKELIAPHSVEFVPWKLPASC